MAENPDGKRPLRRPRLRWNGVVKRDVESLNGRSDWKEREQLIRRIRGLAV